MASLADDDKKCTQEIGVNVKVGIRKLKKEEEGKKGKGGGGGGGSRRKKSIFCLDNFLRKEFQKRSFQGFEAL